MPADETPAEKSPNLAEYAGLPAAQDEGGGSTLTVIIAFAANLVIAIAKTIAALITGSASMVAEAAHSWADAGNEIFLLIADRRSRREPDALHPLGFGRESYVWSMFAALGLFVAGAAVSVTNGIQGLFAPEPASDFLIGYIVLAFSFVFEGISLLQSARQAGAEAKVMKRDLVAHVLRTSDPTLRAVFFEDSAALIGLLIAGLALLAHQLTGSSIPDAIGSILVGLLLGVVATVLINRNRHFLIGEQADPALRIAVVKALHAQPEVDRVTYLRLEIVGPRMINVVGDVDITGDRAEHEVSVMLRKLEAKIQKSPAVVGAVLSLSAPDEPSIQV